MPADPSRRPVTPRSSARTLPLSLAAALAMVIPLTLTACSYTKVVNDPWQNLQQYDSNPGARGRPTDKRPDAPPPEERLAEREEAADRGWAILLDQYEGGSAARRARQLAHRLSHELDVPDVWTKKTPRGVAVYRGQYGDPKIDTALKDLRHTRELELDGLRVFEKAALVNLSQGKAAASASEMDLRRFPGSYTLLVGYYDQEFGRDFRQAAERAAAAIRQTGDDAYFLHAARYSLVGVGLFPPEEIIDGQPSPEAAELQRKHPHYLANGATVAQSIGGASIGERPSSLYKVE